MMALPLEQARAERNAAQEALQARMTQVQEDLAARGIGGRIIDRAGEAVAEAAEVANENKGIVAGTIAAIMLWLLRGPIIRLASQLWTEEEERKHDD